VVGIRRFCTRQKLFVSYASEDRPIAEEIAQALTLEGHDVFFDRRSLKASDHYGERIRKAVTSADRLIFLISRHSLSPGSFTLTEVEFAQTRWPSPAGHVVPVLIDDTVTMEQIPVYLRSVHILQAKGNIAAEVAAAVQHSAPIRPRCWAIAASGFLLLAGAMGLAWSFGGSGPAADVVLQAIEKVHFRPLHEPPRNTAAPDAPTEWAASPVTVTLMPIAYNHRTEPGRRARVLNEQLELRLGSRVLAYRWSYVVEITPRPCADWLCVKGNAGPETLEPGRASAPRETMFLPAGGETASWKDFFDYVIAAPEPQIKIVLRYRIDLPAGNSSHEVTREKECYIDVGQARAAFQQRGFSAGGDVRPPFMQSSCLPSPVTTAP
jgi:hypothetical protein